MDFKGTAGIQSIAIEAVVTRANGQKEDLGVIALWDKDKGDLIGTVIGNIHKFRKYLSKKK
jgi:hypothetical protein